MLVHAEAFREDFEVSMRDVSWLQGRRDEKYAPGEEQYARAEEAKKLDAGHQAEVAMLYEERRVAMEIAYKRGLEEARSECDRKLNRACFDSIR